MSNETKEKLIAAGQQDLVDTHDLIQSGFAGVDKTGKIVDRRVDKKAVPIQENSMFNTPKPKEL